VKRTRLNPVNRERRKREFARAYGSKARVEWIQSLACLHCLSRPSENAHTPSRSGMGRKGDASTIVPLCSACHHRLHQVGLETFQSESLLDLAQCAAIIDAAWTAHISGSSRT